jgi:hypothetical protein
VNAANRPIRVRTILLDGYDYSIISDVRNYNSAKFETYDSAVLVDVEVGYLTVTGDLAPKADPLMPYPLRRTNSVTNPGLYL